MCLPLFPIEQFGCLGEETQSLLPSTFGPAQAQGGEPGLPNLVSTLIQQFLLCTRLIYERHSSHDFHGMGHFLMPV